MLRILCVTAHPDDEAGGFGGVLRLYRDRGVATCVICLTPGQAASHRGGARSDEELASIRRGEFAAACEVLRVSHGEVLDYPDGRLDHIDFYRVVGDLALRIRRLRPQVILTMGPEGAITAHPDHSMASLCATMAFHWAGRSNRFPEQLQDGVRPHYARKLYYATSCFTLPDRQPVALPPATAVIEIGSYLEAKIAAFRAHASQAPLFARMEQTLRQRGNREYFHLAAASHPSMLQPETDLLAGIQEIG